MKSRFDADSLYSNNYLRMHGYAMARFNGKRKHMSLREKLSVPFKDHCILRRGRRVKVKAGLSEHK